MKEMKANTGESDLIERHGQAVKRVRSLYDMHKVVFGEPENLSDLITSVREDRHFAMDFWAFVGDLSARERGDLSDDETLDVLVEAATGMDVASLPPENEPTVEQLRQLLAGVDVGLPADLPDAITAPEDELLAARKRKAKPTRPGAAVVVMTQGWATPAAGESRAKLASLDDTLVARRSIGEALSRIEQTSAQLREQLAAIDEQLVQPVTTPETEVDEPLLEAFDKPHLHEEEEDLEEQAPVVTPRQAWKESPVPPTAPIASAPLMEVEEQRRRERIEAEIFTPRPAHTLSQRGFAPPDPDDDPSIAVPLSAYAAQNEGSNRGRNVAVAAMVLLALALGGFFYARTEAGQEAMARYAPALREQYDAFVERLNVLKREATAKTESSDQVSLAPASSVDNSSQKNAPAREASALPPTAAPTPAPVEAQPVPPASAELPASVELKDRRSREAVGRARVDQSPNEPTGARLIQDSDTVRVAPGVMDANLVASRVPAYPEVAKAEGIQGPVVMEAVISKSGAVDHVRVIQGEKQLRSAAEEAVLKWRYRPYLLNGSPVDVATVIRVDFRLHAGNYSR